MTDIIGPSSSAANVVTARPSDPRVFGPSDTWFKNCTDALSGDGTDITAEFLNGLLAMLRVAVRGMGISEGISPDNFVRDAIRAAKLRFAVAAGAADAVTCTFDPPFAVWDGAVFLLVPSASNTGGAMTCAADGLSAKSIKVDGSDPPAGYFRAGRPVLLMYDGTSLQAISGGSAAPKLTFFSASATWTKQAGRRAALMGVHAPGGAGGGASGIAPNAAGEGGGAGEFRWDLFDISATASAAVTVSAGGAGASNANGGDGGGVTAIAGFLSANPGKGGARNNSGSATTGVGGSGGSGGFGINGSGGGSSSAGTGGTGGPGAFGGGGTAGNGSNSKAAGGHGHRGGGGGGADGNAAGGNGGDGWAFILEF